MLEQWMLFKYPIRHLDITKMFTLAAVIPPPTAEVEYTLSLIKLISTRARKMLSQENLVACMYNCKYKELSECDLQEIMDLWLEAEIQLQKRDKVVPSKRKLAVFIIFPVQHIR